MQVKGSKDALIYFELMGANCKTRPRCGASYRSHGAHVEPRGPRNIPATGKHQEPAAYFAAYSAVRTKT